MDWFTKDRRGGEEGLYTSIDRIFQLIGANRAHYFGRVFEGVDIRKIMAKSDDLFGVDGEIWLKLLEHVINSGIAEKVHKTCDDICLALKLWDGAFSDIHTPNPSVEHCQSTQNSIPGGVGKLMEHWNEQYH